MLSPKKGLRGYNANKENPEVHSETVYFRKEIKHTPHEYASGPVQSSPFEWNGDTLTAHFDQDVTVEFEQAGENYRIKKLRQ